MAGSAGDARISRNTVESSDEQCRREEPVGLPVTEEFSSLRHPMSTTLMPPAMLFVGLLIFAACDASDQRSAKLEDPNIVLIVVDTLSARHIGAYNEEISFTPSIDKLAENGALFSRSYSTTSWTQPAMASLFTSLTNESHGLTTINDALSLELETLAETLESRGYKTAAVISSPLLTEKHGFAQGFETFLQTNMQRPFTSHIPITSAKVSNRSIAWLHENSRHFDESRFFLFAHYFDPHWQYRSHGGLATRTNYRGQIEPGMDIHEIRERSDQLTRKDIDYLIGLYNEEIAFTDQQIGRLLSFLDESGLIENTLIILTADHGEEFLQHDDIGHSQSLYEELIHVPLIFHAPEIFEPRIVDSPVSILDVVPTIFELSSDPIDRPEWEGISLLPYLFDEEPLEDHRNVFSSVAFVNPFDPLDPKKNTHKTALISGDFKLIHDRPTDSWELYNLSQDPLEKKPLAETRPDILGAMMSRILNFENRQTGRSGSDPESHDLLGDDELEALKNLGYIR
jgi:arylsulfatase A-like enzyme